MVSFVSWVRSLAVASGACLVLSGNAAAALPLPGLFEDEAVKVKEVVSAREVVVTRDDASTVRVRFPGVTVPTTTADGGVACGAASARSALARLLPVGRVISMSGVARDRFTAWLPFSAAESELPQLASDGAFYGDLTSDARALDRFEGSILDALAAQGWLRGGVPLPSALNDPTEVGFIDADRYTETDILIDESQLNAAGVFGACGGDFAAAAPAAVQPTNWKVSRLGRVRSIGGVPVRASLTGKQLAAALGAPSITLTDNACELQWPSRGLTAHPLAWTADHGRSVAPPGRTAPDCLARRITDLDQLGPALRLAGLRPRTKWSRVHQIVPALRIDRDDPRWANAGKTYGRDGSLAVGLDRSDRLQRVSATVPTR